MPQDVIAKAKEISLSEFDNILSGGHEFALLDVRESGLHGRDGHILISISLPLSQLELRAWTLLPRRNVRIVVTDSGDGFLSARAVKKLTELGYGNLSILAGGVNAWRDAGREIYTGVSAYSKAFGEFVEATYKTPHVTALQLKRLLDEKADIVVLDGRTVQEFQDFSIPGAYSVPNAELPYRVHGLLGSDETLVVVNYAGRTRSIIGAQALINSGLRNRVFALENGTMAWLFENYQLDHGRVNFTNAPGEGQKERAGEAVDRLTKRFDLNWLDAQAFERLKTEKGQRTLYLFDVRTQPEFEAGHLPDARWVEGGELVQGIDKYAAVRNSRIVVIDNQYGVRAAITASWLVQLGWGETYAFASPMEGIDIETGAEIPSMPESLSYRKFPPTNLTQRCAKATSRLSI